MANSLANRKRESASNRRKSATTASKQPVLHHFDPPSSNQQRETEFINIQKSKKSVNELNENGSDGFF